MFEPVMWNSFGEMELVDGERTYTYCGVTRDVYEKVGKMCRQGRKGEVYQLLVGFSEKAESVKEAK